MKHIFQSIKIQKSTHKILKQYCDKNNIKLNLWVDSLILSHFKKKKEKENDNIQNNQTKLKNKINDE